MTDETHRSDSAAAPGAASGLHHTPMRHSHVRVAVAAAAGLAAILVGRWLPLVLQDVLVLGWDVFAVVLLVQGGFLMAHAPAAYIRQHAQTEDSGRTAMTLLLGAASTASFFIVVVVGPMHVEDVPVVWLHAAIVLVAVASAWLLIHVVFAFHYAHLFYRSPGDAPDSDGERQAGGLHFPGTGEPDYLDFLYFSVMLGMTFQISDVSVTGRRIRMTVLVHSLLSFVFTTTIIAQSVNVLIGMTGRG
jgi:uncharacterized membrane protein